MTRVLVIDDEAPIRLLCRVNLEAEQMEVLEASDGPSGLELAKTYQRILLPHPGRTAPVSLDEYRGRAVG